jgi:hypothetical protein
MAPCLGACFSASLAALGGHHFGLTTVHVPLLLTRFRISDSDVAPVKRETSPAWPAAASIQFDRSMYTGVYVRTREFIGSL